MKTYPSLQNRGAAPILQSALETPISAGHVIPIVYCVYNATNG